MGNVNEESSLNLHDIGLLRLQFNKDIYTMDMSIFTGEAIKHRLQSLGIEIKDYVFDNHKFSVTVSKDREIETMQTIYDSINEYLSLHNIEIFDLCCNIFDKEDNNVLAKYNYIMANTNLLLKEQIIPISNSSDVEVSVFL